MGQVFFDLSPRTEFTKVFSVRGGSMTLRLIAPKTSERFRISHVSRMQTNAPEYEDMLKLVASKFFVGFTGAVDRDGKEIPDTEANRLALLQSSMALTSFILGELGAEADRVDEGNADSAFA